MSDPTEPMKRTPLYDAHVARGARMVPFAGYEMPVQYAGENGGVLNEHRWTREHAGLFDVSHMGQATITGAAAVSQFERFCCGDYQGLKEGKQRYSLFLNDEGGILDDLMAAKPSGQDGLFVVVNAACKDDDFGRLQAGLRGDATLTRLEDRALIAIQGPEAAEVMARHNPELADMGFMDSRKLRLFGVDAYVSRSGYTGEDGYEISVPAADAERIWNTILEDDKVRPIGLGARDSLRLEAGLPLYGHDADETTSPVEADLAFALNKRRREAGDYPGASRIQAEQAGALKRVRVGLKVTGAPAREGAEIADAGGVVIGKVTSGGPSPSLGSNIAMGYVPPSHSVLGTALKVIVRGRPQDAEVVAMPFVPKRFYRKPEQPAA
ncbi:MAG: glycine cleavage system aminomethyltransferase GcvT [Caulobacteraceae bacterium]|nr:glycine cleavage system aminomethyltransferase GcvT [Caulobacteraceae bacterium]